MLVRSLVGLLASLAVLAAASRLSSATIVAADANAYQEVKGWPTLPAGMQFGEVAGVDVDAHGHVFVFHRPGRGFEPGATSVLDDPAVVEIDAERGTVVASWGAKTFFVPHGITVDHENNIFLTDVGLQQVFKYTHDGKQLLALGQPRVGGWDATHFNQPTDIAILRNGSFYVSDGYVNSRVALFDRNGTWMKEWGSKGDAEGQFSNPHGLAFAPNGDVLVADRQNSRIQVFDRQGVFKQQWTGARPIGRVFSVAVDGAGSMYVGVRKADYDPASNGVLKLDRNWNRVAAIGFGAAGDPTFNAVHDLAIGRDGSIYVAETRTKRVVKLRPKLSVAREASRTSPRTARH
jgi:peptidylamidoglycolate lyase